MQHSHIGISIVTSSHDDDIPVSSWQIVTWWRHPTSVFAWIHVWPSCCRWKWDSSPVQYIVSLCFPSCMAYSCRFLAASPPHHYVSHIWTVSLTRYRLNTDEFGISNICFWRENKLADCRPTSSSVFFLLSVPSHLYDFRIWVITQHIIFDVICIQGICRDARSYTFAIWTIYDI